MNLSEIDRAELAKKLIYSLDCTEESDEDRLDWLGKAREISRELHNDDSLYFASDKAKTKALDMLFAILTN